MTKRIALIGLLLLISLSLTDNANALVKSSGSQSVALAANPISPTGTITTSVPEYSWTAVAGATNYHVKVKKGSKNIYSFKTSSTSYLSPSILSNKDYRWKARAKVGGDWKSWSAWEHFTVDAEPTYITWHDDGESFPAGNALIWRWGWVNCEKGLSYDWRDITYQSYLNVEKDGVEFTEDIVIPEETALEYWGVPFYWRDDSNCYWDSPQAWRIWWQHPNLVFSQPGVYTLDVIMGTTRELIDGWHLTDPGGIPHLYEARDWANKTVTITILE